MKDRCCHSSTDPSLERCTAAYAVAVSPTTTAETISTIWRTESARLVGALIRMTRDLDLAEDLAQDALVAALEQWPDQGVPTNPGAWLMSIAKRRGIDGFRRAETLHRKTQELARTGEADAMPDLTDQVDFIEDDVLRLIFLSCHPALTPESRAALTLRMVGGLTTGEIARGFVSTEKSMGQRISRAKKTLREAGADFELPTGADRAARLDDVMAVIYLVFNEGYTATAGGDWMRPELTAEAIRLARMLATLMPDEPDVHGLQSLLELQASRVPARVDAQGNAVLLDDQDRSRWDELLIRRGLAALDRAEALATRGKPVGSYFLQAQMRRRMGARARPTTPIGAPSPRSTTCSPRPHPARWSRSTGRSRTVARSGRTPASRCSTPSRTTRCPAPTCPRRCAVTCCCGWAARTRRRRRLVRRPSSLATSASAPSCWPVLYQRTKSRQTRVTPAYRAQPTSKSRLARVGAGATGQTATGRTARAARSPRRASAR